MASPLDPFIHTFDARERFQLRVRAPAPLVYETAAGFDMQSVGLVRSIFRLREWMMGAPLTSSSPFSAGFLAGAKAMGWGVLRDEPGRIFIAGAHCQPWNAAVTFMPLAARTFAGFSEPNRVKIAWTLETEPVDGGHSLLASETRAVATSPEAQRSFRRYWRWARFGIHSIRWLLLPAIRRRAETRYR
jgi:hypothetical protein